VQALDRNRRVTVVPFQKAGVPAAQGLSVAQCESSAWAITPDQQRYPGAMAVNLVLAIALGTRLPLWIYAVPGIRQFQDSAYAWVVRNRSHLPGDTPYCEQYPEACR
jgi:predicted DCC family thiol-disulfide oxidoreductase YuxK